MSGSVSRNLSRSQLQTISEFLRTNRYPILQACNKTWKSGNHRKTREDPGILKFFIPVLLDLLIEPAAHGAPFDFGKRLSSVTKKLKVQPAGEMSRACTLQGESILKKVLDRFIDENLNDPLGKKDKIKKYLVARIEKCATMLSARASASSDDIPLKESSSRLKSLKPAEKLFDGNPGAAELEARRIESEMNKLRELHSGLLDFILEAVLLVDISTAKIMDANREAEKLTGYPRMLLRGISIMELAAEADNRQLGKALQNPKEHRPLEFHIHGSGGKRVKAVLSSPRFRFGDSNASICRLFCESDDVQRASQGNPAAGESAALARYRRTFEISQAVLFIASANGEILDLNPYASKIFGIAGTQEARGVSLAELLFSAEKDRSRFLEEMQESGCVKDFEYEYSNRNGEIYILRMTCVSRKNEQGRIVEYHGFVEDVSELRKLENLFCQAQKMETLGALTGGIAHDFNNILAFIIPNVQMMKMIPNLPDQVHEYADNIQNAARRAAKLTEQLLSFSRRGESKLISLNLNSRVKEIIKLLDRSIDKIIRIIPKLEPNLDNVEADVSKVDQVLINLSLNARDAMESGGTLSFTTENRILDQRFCEKHGGLRPGKYVYISVKDTGTGIDPSILERIFDPFFTTKEAGKGTGFGLSVVDSIIKNCGGRITVESEPGCGTTFHIYLPSTSKTIPEETVDNRLDILSGKETILLVDDEESIRVYIGKILQYLGYKVITAKNGMEAVKLYAENRDAIDLVILDIVMPVQEGKVTLARLKKLNPNRPILLSSGYDKQGKAEAETLDKAAGFLQKPYDVIQLSRVIREILDS